jgi:hypothetical protein
MSALETLARAKAAGVVVLLENGRLFAETAGAPPPDIVALLKATRRDVVRVLECRAAAEAVLARRESPFLTNASAPIAFTSSSSPEAVIAALLEEGFRIAVIPPSGALAIQDATGWRGRHPRPIPPHLLKAFGEQADAIGRLIEERSSERSCEHHPAGLMDDNVARAPDDCGYTRSITGIRRWTVEDDEGREREYAKLTYGPPQSRWEIAMRGLKRFLAEGWGDKAALLGWTANELYAVPPTWTRLDLTGAALLIGDRRVVAVTADNIVTETRAGSTLRFRRIGREHLA